MADATDRVAAVEANLDALLAGAVAPPDGHVLDPNDEVAPGSGLTARAAVELFEDMVRSRVLDVVGREMKSRGEGFYTISSAGHEMNAMVGALTRATDPALLHYRSGAFYMARERRAAADTGEARNPVRDVLASLASAATDPVSRGRHKVWGSRADWIIPQTSTIGSHPPKATGTAFAIDLARRLDHDIEIPRDSIVVCSFGDASANHATTLSGINAARYSKRLGASTPILFVCEDNGLGISVPTPRGWIEDTYGNLKHLRYLRADGDVAESWATVQEAVSITRERRMPVFLHLPTVRLWGHAGSDHEASYRPLTDIRASEAADPLLAMASFLLEHGVATPDTLRGIVGWTRTQVRALAIEIGAEPHLSTAREVMEALGGTDGDQAREDAVRDAGVSKEARAQAFQDHLPEDATQPVKRTMAAHINATLADQMLRRPEMLVFGEDVGRKGGVYGVTSGLQRAFGQQRVFDTLLDETTVLGTAQGAGLMGFLPVPEIQYLAYLHNAIDQLRGEAASMSFFSDGQFTNPMVIRVAGLAYQKGFGGHFHNDNAIGALREIPGIVLAVPSRGDEAARMLRGSLAVAKALGRVVVFLEPIAQYHERDLHRAGDGGWLTDYPAADDVAYPGEVSIHDEPGQAGQPALLLVTYGNGVRMSRRVAKRLADERGVNVRVLDVRWLLPFATSLVKAHADACQHVLVVDEARSSGGIADMVVAALVERGYTGKIASVRSRDTFVPLGPAANAVLLQEDDIHAAAVEVVGGPAVHPRVGEPVQPVEVETAAASASAAVADAAIVSEPAEPAEEPAVVPEVVEQEPVPVTVEPEPEPEPEPAAVEPDPEPAAVEPEPEPLAVEPDPEPVAVEPDPEPEAEPLAVEPDPEPEPQRLAVQPEPYPNAAPVGMDDGSAHEATPESAVEPVDADGLPAFTKPPERVSPPPLIVDERPAAGWHEEPSTTDDEPASGPPPTPPSPPSDIDPTLFTARGGKPRKRGR